MTYSNDGSSLNCTGNFVVQSFNINGEQRILPTLGIFAETKRSLDELVQTTLEILSTATGYMYTESQIMAKIDFVMTDSTSHNLGVIEMVSGEKESEYVPSSLAPKTNESLSSKDQRFNHIFECCYSLAHCMDDIKSHLEKFSSAVNGLNITDGSFLDMGVLKPFFCATSLIGKHITGPYQYLLINVDSSYDKLLQAFPKNFIKNLTI